jgi:hypothetical protein
MELLKSIEKTEVKKGCIVAVIEVFKTVKRNVKHSSADKRAGKWVADVYSDVAFITVNGVQEYFCHISNGITEAVELFNDGEFRKYLPKL